MATTLAVTDGAVAAAAAAAGDGNLGLRGMALFFRTHECNLLCSRLKLDSFDRCATDVAAQVRQLYGCLLLLLLLRGLSGGGLWLMSKQTVAHVTFRVLEGGPKGG
jgi:hypothetical protein